MHHARMRRRRFAGRASIVAVAGPRTAESRNGITPNSAIDATRRAISIRGVIWPTRKTFAPRAIAALFGAAIALSSAARATIAQTANAAPHRAILVSFDGFSEQRFREYADSATAPHLWAMFRQDVCAESVRPAFPSVTPTSHASIWTGAYSNVNGVSASANGKLPLLSTSILESTDGYRATALRAEPLWISAARQGKTVYSHMATQSPQPPLYMPLVRPTPQLDSARNAGAKAMALPNIAALNVYNDLVAPARVIHNASELSFAFGTEGDSLHGRVQDDSTVVFELIGDSARSVSVRLAPTDTTSPIGRPLARYFSAPLRVDLARGRRTFVFFRLFELSHDHSSMQLFVSEARVIQANRADVAQSYDDAVQGEPGNGGTHPMAHGEFGPRVPNGGDGTAEYRYMETAELVTRQFMRGAEWGWKTYHPELEIDYLPYPDEILHTFIGYADPHTPDVTPATRRNAARMLARGYALVDLRVAQLENLARSEPNTRLFVTGEHGMRPTWLSFRPNVLLRDAGLLTLDASGAIDLRRTKAAFVAGGWVIANRATRKLGTVPADSVGPILARAEAALRDARDSAGTQIVTRFFHTSSVEGDSLGIGGAGGGDLYFDLAPGYYASPIATGPMAVPLAFPQGEHGYPSIDIDMHPALCIVGAGKARRIGEVRSIDIAPTISAWLGISPPGDARGKVLIH